MKSMLRLTIVLAIIGLVPGAATADISITSLAQGYTQDFNTLPIQDTGTFTWIDNSTLDGWYRRANTNNTDQNFDADLVDYAVKGDQVGAPGFYNVSTAGNSDRAVGFRINGQPSGLKKGSVGVIFINQTGSTIESFDVAYRGENWYRTVNDTTLKFQWMVTNSFADISSDIDRAGVAWNDAAALDWTVPAAGGSSWQNGSTLANGTNLSATVSSGVNLADGQVLILRWRIPETGTQEHGLFIDDVVITNFLTAPKVVGNSKVVFFGGDAGIFDGDATVNNQFVEQTDAGHIIQWNGVNSDGGSFGASGSLVNKGVGGALTNSANDLILTTVDIVPVGSNTFATGLPQVMGITGGDNAKFNTALGEAWTFEFNRQVRLKQLVVTALESSTETVRVAFEGLDTTTFTYLEMSNLLYEATANKYIYTYPTPILVPAGADITIDGPEGTWGLQGVVVEVASVVESLSLINFGGNPDLKSDATYLSELGGDAIIAWWGGDDDGRFQGDVGTLNNQAVGATLSSIKYGVTIESMAIEPSGSNTFVSGGSLGITGGDNAKLDGANGEAWTLRFDSDVYLYRVGLKGFTDGFETAEIITGGTTNSITPAECVTATSESGLTVYTLADGLFITAGSDVEIRAAAGQFGVGNLVVGVDAPAATPGSLYAAWLADYQLTLGTATNLTDNWDNDSLNNLHEYAQGGDPTNPGDTGNGPEFQVVDISGTNFFACVYYKRSDAAARGLTYEVELDDDLVFPPGWAPTGIEVIDGTYSGNFLTVTNLVPTAGKSEQFMNLKVGFQ